MLKREYLYVCAGGMLRYQGKYLAQSTLVFALSSLTWFSSISTGRPEWCAVVCAYVCDQQHKFAEVKARRRRDDLVRLYSCTMCLCVCVCDVIMVMQQEEICMRWRARMVWKQDVCVCVRLIF